MNKVELLHALTFGGRVAEEEQKLDEYFVETSLWTELFDDKIDVVYGSKGAGKSALYSLLLKRRETLKGRGILLVGAENPQGAPAFEALVSDPPSSEEEFRVMWKLYFLSLMCELLSENGINNSSAQQVIHALEDAGLRRKSMSLNSLVQVVASYAKRLARLESVETTIKPDPSGIAAASLKITFSESVDGDPSGTQSVGQLFDLADRALAEAGKVVWVAVDRLDVAFATSAALEENALRALFRAYSDLLGLKNMRLKIFLRSDIWNRITRRGFREASHITRAETIKWDEPSLLNLVVRRMARNTILCDFYDVTYDAILGSQDTQRSLFYRVFPIQVDVGSRRPRTFDWMLSRTRDGTQNNAPRELIHLATAARHEQLGMLDTGETIPEGERLFTGAAIKDALAEVSRARLNQTLYAEYPELKRYLDNLAGAKTNQTAATLSEVWGLSESEASEIAKQLVEVGFFEPRGTREQPEYWVPFLYRDALGLVQGTEESD